MASSVRFVAGVASVVGVPHTGSRVEMVPGVGATVRRELDYRIPTGPPLELDDVILGVLGQNALGA